MLVATVSTTGCFNSAHMVQTKKRVERVLDTSVVEESVIPKSKSVALEYQFVEGELIVHATQQEQCKQRRIETYKQFEVVTQHLPSEHWWTFTSGALLAGAGAAGIAMGADLNPPGETGAIMSPTEAEDRDTGKVMVPVGIGLAAVGGLLLGSELTDWIMLTDRKIPKSPTVERIPMENIACKQGPAKNVELSLSPPPTSRGGGHRINFRADENGRAVLDVLSSPLVDYAFAQPFGVITCEHCEGQPLHIPAELSAELVVVGKREADLEGWMKAYPNPKAPMAAPVIAELKAIAKRQAEIRRINPERERQAAQEHLWAGRVMRARKAATRCLLKRPRHSGCKKLLGEIDKLVLEDLTGRAKQYIRWQVPQRALLVLDECLSIRPRYRPCSKLKDKAGRMWSKAKQGISYRVRRVEKKRKKTKIVTEVKSRNDFENLQLSVSVYKGDDPVCMRNHVVGGIARQETVAFEIACDSAIDKIDRVVIRVDNSGV
ncbi:MAG: hypothetical protein CL940_05660 [Deltaproteobacteria bacterium]|nr:hypothetical protein [Deltaproteobacteria bacterium]